MCSITPISLTVGANRIVPTIAIPHPLGDPNLDDPSLHNPDLTEEERMCLRALLEKKLRRALVEKALKALQTEVHQQTLFDE